MLQEFLRHRDEFKLLYNGKLTKREGWKNIKEHQVVQLFGAKVLGELLGISDDDREKLESVALVHDWKKRLDRFPGEFSHEEIQEASVMLDKINPDKGLMNATGPEFLEKVLHEEVPVLEFLQFYLDDITKGDDIVPFDERIDEVSARRRDLDDDEDLTKRLGGRKYWDLEREIGHEVEQFIFNRLAEKGVVLESPKEIPNLIRSKVVELINV